MLFYFELVFVSPHGRGQPESSDGDINLSRPFLLGKEMA